MYQDEVEGIRDSQDRTWYTRINYDVYLDFLATSLRFANFIRSSLMDNAYLKEGRKDSEEGN
jgi:hypothetical protein